MWLTKSQKSASTAVLVLMNVLKRPSPRKRKSASSIRKNAQIVDPASRSVRSNVS